ncbi:hypothetical protein GHT06_007896 [Daphnia sinensis]|uniref:Uncharacterized protein n=1 Tax=Daphnia sinensis TaxID=1820382 RepID=A0AAD5LKT1_9CRUS|nr:hypothetical protein GHT06_007896 [Daphnia sinensis]
MCRDLELKMRFRISDHVTPVTAPNIVVASAAARSRVKRVEVAGLFPFRVGGDRKKEGDEPLTLPFNLNFHIASFTVFVKKFYLFAHSSPLLRWIPDSTVYPPVHPSVAFLAALTNLSRTRKIFVTVHFDTT